MEHDYQVSGAVIGGAIERLIPLFTAQVVSYLKITGLRVGLILNFNCSKMTEGIKRVVR